MVKLTPKSDEIFDRILNDTSPDCTRSPKHEALVYLAMKKVEEIQIHFDSQELQIIDILEFLIKNITHKPDGDESELDCMADCANIIKIVFRGKKGEQACNESKIVREENEKEYGSNSVISAVPSSQISPKIVIDTPRCEGITARAGLPLLDRPKLLRIWRLKPGSSINTRRLSKSNSGSLFH
ncbi:hypothetical protein BDC45DRAFT_569316 [Circinella umbellata]|nr:hypothetical protein BDC45DRAFT_569316 [Circinella umbellata]